NVTSDEDGAGGLVGQFETDYPVGEGLKIDFSYNTGTISGVYEIGGLIGYAENTTISESYSTGKVGGLNADEIGGSSEAGGLVAEPDRTSIESSYATGGVTATQEVGGLRCYAQNSSLEGDNADHHVENGAALQPDIKLADYEGVVAGNEELGRVTGGDSGARK